MAKFKALSRGSQIVLVAGPLLFLSLFLTWQNVEVHYTAGTATASLDGWDAWGLLLALLVAAAVTIVALLSFTEDVMSAEINWSKVTFALGVAILGVVLLKNLTDASSSWASYGFVALAGAVALGTYRDWAANRQDAKPALGQKRRRGLRSAA